MGIVKSVRSWQLHRITRRIWFRATFFALLSVAGALIAVAIAPVIPDQLAERIGADAVGSLLEILASSMLIVATFSLSTVISAYAAASAATTPRVTELLLRDPTAQNALSTFVGGFLFSLVGIIGLRSGIYGTQGHVVLFALTILMIVAIVGTFLHWVDVLSHFGRVSDAIDRTAEAAAEAVQRLVGTPCLGARPTADAPEAAHEVTLEQTGYVRYVDVEALQQIAVDGDGEIVVRAPPGAFLDGTRPLAAATFEPDEDTREAICEAFDVDSNRTFEQDPPYAVSALAEIGIKALSPAVNDPETASRVIDRLVRVLTYWRDEPCPDDVECDRVYLPKIDTAKLFGVAFAQLAVYGAADVRVGIRLQEALSSLATSGDASSAAAAGEQSVRALALAKSALVYDRDYEALVAAAPAPGANGHDED